MQTTYQATFDGQTFRRRSSRVYTHAAIFRHQISNALDATFHGSESAARNATSRWWLDEQLTTRTKEVWLKPIAIVKVHS